MVAMRGERCPAQAIRIASGTGATTADAVSTALAQATGGSPRRASARRGQVMGWANDPRKLPCKRVIL